MPATQPSYTQLDEEIISLEEQPQAVKHHNQREIMVIVADNIAKMSANRITSVGLFWATQQAFSRNSEANLILAVYMSVMADITNFFRELSTRFISNETAIAASAENNVSELQKIFRTTAITAFPTAILISLFTQAYTFALPFMGCPEDAANELQKIPIKYLGNTYLIVLHTGQAVFASGIGDVTRSSIAYVLGGGAVFTAYMWIRKLDSGIDGLYLANVAQNLVVITAYSTSLQIYHPEKRLLQSVFNYREWLSSLKHAFAIMKQGIQPAGILLLDAMSNAIIPRVISSKTQLAGYQAPRIFFSTYMSLNISNEGRLAALVIEATKRLKDDPDQLATELKYLLLHFAWIGNVIPAIFLVLTFSLNKQIVSLLVKPTDENAEVINIAEKELWLVALAMIFRTWRAAGYGVVAAFKSGDAYHQKQNLYATMTNISMTFVALFIGIALDYGAGMGAYGYWLGTVIGFGMSGLGVTLLAMNSIYHEKTKVYQQITGIEESPSKSWMGMWFDKKLLPESLELRQRPTV